MKRAILPLTLLFIPAVAIAQGGHSEGVVFISGKGTGGVNVAVCQPLATIGAGVSNNHATLLMASNPITAGFVASVQLTVAGFTGADTYFNGTFTIQLVTPTTITYSLMHANASASSNGTAFQTGNSATPCAALSPIFTDSTITAISPNPFTTDGLGNYGFWSAPGQYQVQRYGPTVTTTVRSTTISEGSGNSRVPDILQSDIIAVDGVNYACSDVGLNAAIVVAEAYPDGGGVVDASGCNAANYNIGNTVTLGSVTKRVTLMLDSRAAWVCTIRGASPCWDIWGQSSITCAMVGTNNCSLDVSSNTVPSVVRSNPSQVQENIQLRNIEIRNSAGGVPTVALVDLSSAYDSQFWMSINLRHGGTRGLYIHGASSGICPNADTFNDLDINGFYEIGSRPLVIKADTACPIGPLDFVGGDFGHPGAANYLVELDGNGKVGGLYSMNFSGIYMEDYNTNQSTPPTVYVNDSRQVTFSDIDILRMNDSATEYGYELHESLPSGTGNIVWINGTITGGLGHNFVQNDITGVNSVLNGHTYFDFLNPEDGTTNNGAQIGGIQFNGNSSEQFPEMTAASASPGFDTCYADSTAHALKCSYNGGSFLNVPQVIGSGTATLWTSSISSNSCAPLVTVSATGVAITDAISWSFNSDPSSITGYGAGSSGTSSTLSGPTADQVILGGSVILRGVIPPGASSTGTLSIWSYTTADHVNFRVCNLTGGPITPGAATLNWRVVR